MTTKAHAFIVHPAMGGLDTLTAPTLLKPDELQVAENVEYLNPGSKKKRLGTQRHSGQLVDENNSEPLVIRALADFWHNPDLNPNFPQYLLGLGGSSIGGTLVLNDTAQQNDWSTSGSSVFGHRNATFCITLADSYAVLSTSQSGGTSHLKWNTSDPISVLSSCAPQFAFSVYHLRRLWMAGVHTDNNERSRVYFSAAGDITDCSGEDAGSLFFDQGDGDEVLGISKPFRGSLYVFKGPHYGSIHVVSGRTIRSFTRDKMMHTAPVVAHQAIVTTENDIYWLSRYGVHSLLATQKYGNTEEAYVSHKIKNMFPRLDQNAITQACSFYHPTRNLVGWFVPESGQTENTIGLVYNYALGHWAVWRYSFHVASCAIFQDPSSAVPRLFLGGYDGYIRAADQSVLLDDSSTAYTSRVKFPVLIRLGQEMSELTEKSFQSVTTFFNPQATGSSAELEVTIDGRLTSYTVSMQSTGGTWGSGTFGSAVFGGFHYFAETPIADRGRAIQLDYTNSGANQDMDLLGYAIRAVPAEGIAMEAS